ncbi:MAG: diguanylate cyclase [Ramlibacter sp.]|nr:diguanylate cyclase [Ramlibacter sp.]
MNTQTHQPATENAMAGSQTLTRTGAPAQGARLGAVVRWLGSLLRRPAGQTAKDQCDASTGLYNQPGFLVEGDRTLAACARAHQPASLVVFDCADLHELRALYGAVISRRVMARLIARLTDIAGERGLVARTAPTEFALLLPGAGRDKAIAAIRRVLGRSGCVEYDGGDSEIVVVPDFLVEVVCQDDGLLGAALVRMRRDLRQRRSHEAHRQQYLTRERERHSRPANLMPHSPMREQPAMPRRASGMLAMPATLPVPLVYTR